MKRKALLLILSFFFTCTLKAQTYNFGDVPIEQLEMTVYEKDSTAKAIVLFDKGETLVGYRNSGFFVKFTRHIRVKILADDGLDLGDIEIGFRNTDPKQAVRNIKAESYTLNDNGKVEKEKVGRRDRFIEKVSDTWSQVKFTVPGLRKGSVFEYSYEVNSNHPMDFPNWFFQRDIPVLWSEYFAQIPEWFSYRTVTRGHHSYFKRDQERYSDRIYFHDRNGSTTFDYSGTEYHFVMKDIPAIVEEPFMKASIDYLAHVRFQLAWVQLPNSMVTNYLSNWGELTDKLLEDEDFGERLQNNSVLAERTAELVEDTLDQTEKMTRIYDHVSNTMEWDESYNLYAFEDLEEIYEKGTGNGSAINLILVEMLRDAGLEAHPVALSTRTNGEIIKLFPSTTQFNHTIAYVEIDGDHHLLDAKNEKRPHNLLPIAALNGEGLLIIGGTEKWIPLTNDTPHNEIKLVNIDFGEEGYTGTLTSQNHGFLALDYRNSFDFNELNTSIKDHVFNDRDGFSVDSSKVVEDISDGKFEFVTHFSQSNLEAEDIIYFNPMITDRLEENPFKIDDRTYPVDYGFTFDKRMFINIIIPEGWVVDEIPQSLIYRLPEETGEFQRLAQANGNIISIRYRFRINKEKFMPYEYTNIKEMYDQMVSKLSENIVLKKES